MDQLPPHQVVGQGPTVLLVHGTAPDIFTELTRALSSDHAVVRVTRRGFPGSNLAPVRTLTPHAEDAAAILASRGDAAVVVGWSIGGIIALELALRHPERVAGLVLLEPPWLAKKHPTLRMLGGILGGKLRGALGNPGGGGLRFLQWALRHADGTSALDHLPPAEHRRIAEAGDAMLAELDGGTGEHLASAVRPLPVPVALLVGTRSTPEFPAAAERLAALLGVDPIVVDGAGHLLQETHAEAVARVVRGLATARGRQGTVGASRSRPS